MYTRTASGGFRPQAPECQLAVIAKPAGHQEIPKVSFISQKRGKTKHTQKLK